MKLECKSINYINSLSTLYGHIKTVEQQAIVQQYHDRYAGGWWVDCYIWYVQWGGAWVGWDPAQSPPHCTKCNIPPINCQPVYQLHTFRTDGQRLCDHTITFSHWLYHGLLFVPSSSFYPILCRRSETWDWKLRNLKLAICGWTETCRPRYLHISVVVKTQFWETKMLKTSVMDHHTCDSV